MVLFIIAGYIIWYDDKVSVGAYHILTINLMFTFLILLFHWCSAQQIMCLKVTQWQVISGNYGTIASPRDSDRGSPLFSCHQIANRQ